MAISDLRHGRYVIRFQSNAEGVRARAFLWSKDGPVSLKLSSGGFIDAVGATPAAAAQKVEALLAERDQALQSARIDQIPTAEEYANTFLALTHEVGDHHRRLLRALLAAPEHTLTATELAMAADWTAYEAVNLHLGKLGARFALELGIPLPHGPDGKPVGTFALCDGPQGYSPATGHWRWTLRPQVADALKGLGW